MAPSRPNGGRRTCTACESFEIKPFLKVPSGERRVLPAGKVTAEMRVYAAFREGCDSAQPQTGIMTSRTFQELLDQVQLPARTHRRPVGVKTAVGGWEFMNDLCDSILRRRQRLRAGFSKSLTAAKAQRRRASDYDGYRRCRLRNPSTCDRFFAAVGTQDRVRVCAAGKLVHVGARGVACARADFVNTLADSCSR